MADSIPYIVIVLSLLPLAFDIIQDNQEAPRWLSRALRLFALLSGLLLMINQFFDDEKDASRDKTITDTSEGVDSLQLAQKRAMESLIDLTNTAEEVKDSILDVNGNVAEVLRQLDRALLTNEELVGATVQSNRILEDRLRAEGPKLVWSPPVVIIDKRDTINNTIRLRVSLGNSGTRPAIEVTDTMVVVYSVAIDSFQSSIDAVGRDPGSIGEVQQNDVRFLWTDGVPVETWTSVTHALILLKLNYADPLTRFGRKDTILTYQYVSPIVRPNLPTFNSYNGYLADGYKSYLDFKGYTMFTKEMSKYIEE